VEGRSGPRTDCNGGTDKVGPYLLTMIMERSSPGFTKVVWAGTKSDEQRVWRYQECRRERPGSLRRKKVNRRY